MARIAILGWPIRADEVRPVLRLPSTDEPGGNLPDAFLDLLDRELEDLEQLLADAAESACAFAARLDGDDPAECSGLVLEQHDRAAARLVRYAQLDRRRRCADVARGDTGCVELDLTRLREPGGLELGVKDLAGKAAGARAGDYRGRFNGASHRRRTQRVSV